MVNCDPDVNILGEPIFFHEILLNLLLNSAKFSPRNATITITVNSVQRRKKQKVKVSIEDEAGGIPEEKSKLIFQPFTKDNLHDDGIHGFHLGMYIVHEFTRLLKGEIQFDTIPGVGSKFNLYFNEYTSQN